MDQPCQDTTHCTHTHASGGSALGEGGPARRCVALLLTLSYRVLLCLWSVTPCLAIDCEFVGVGVEGVDNALARVSIVNFHSAVVYDKYVKPSEPVTDYRTSVSGIRPQHIHSKGAVTFKQAQREVAQLIEGKILVGHAVQNDLQVLLLSHPKHLLRDTSKYKGLCPDRSEREGRGGAQRNESDTGRESVVAVSQAVGPCAHTAGWIFCCVLLPSRSSVLVR